MTTISNKDLESGIASLLQDQYGGSMVKARRAAAMIMALIKVAK
jgi:hypothetical protein